MLGLGIWNDDGGRADWFAVDGRLVEKDEVGVLALEFDQGLLADMPEAGVCIAGPRVDKDEFDRMRPSFGMGGAPS